MNWIPGFDMSTVPDFALYGEVGRRRSAARGTRTGGRPKVMHECKHCLCQMPAVAWRDHVPRCPRNPKNLKASE